MAIKFRKSGLLTEDQKLMLEGLLDAAKAIRASYKYSGDEQMIPTAFIVTDEGMNIMPLGWANNKEKYQQAAMANAAARSMKADCLAFATDSRFVKGETFAEYYRFPPIKEMGFEKFHREYHRILDAHGGEVKNLPREIWSEAVTIFANGPNFPLTIKMAQYKEGPNDTIDWLEVRDAPANEYKSDLLTDWWN